MKEFKKICGCGEVHTSLPESAKAWVNDGKLLGYFWNCKCKSTLFIKRESLYEKSAA